MYLCVDEATGMVSQHRRQYRHQHRRDYYQQQHRRRCHHYLHLPPIFRWCIFHFTYFILNINSEIVTIQLRVLC